MASDTSSSAGSLLPETRHGVKTHRLALRKRVPRKLRLAMQVGLMFAVFAAFYVYSSVWSAAAIPPSQQGGAQDVIAEDVIGHSVIRTQRRLLTNATEPTCEVTGGDISVAGAIVGNSKCCPADEKGFSRGTCCSAADKWWGVIIYFVVVLYTFLGLAIICDDYFCESLEQISEALKLSDDVAGATFMAAGSSAPELFTAVVTTLITGGSEGLGTIVGSAIFNIMIIVGVTAICAGQTLKIWWYPLSRDCIVYVISIAMLAAVVADKKVFWYEGLILTLSYGGYIFLMVKNEKITDWIESRSSKVNPSDRSLTAALSSGKFSALETSNGKAGAGAGGAGAGSGNTSAPGSRRSSNKDISAAASALAAAARGQDAPALFGGEHTSMRAVERQEAAAAMEGTTSSRVLLAPLRSPKKSSPAGGAGGSTTAGAGATTATAATAAGAGAGAAVLPMPVSKPKPKPKSKPKEPTHKRGMNPLLRPMNRASADTNKAKKRAADRAQLQLGTLMKVHSAKTLFLKKLKSRRTASGGAGGGGGLAGLMMNARKTAATGTSPSTGGAGGSGAGAGGGAGSAGATSSPKPAGGASLMLAALERGEKKKEEEEAKQDDDDDGDDEGCTDKILNVLSIPYTYLFKFTVPDCREKKWAKWYMLTFTMSIVWIGVLSFLMVDFASRAGCVMGVPGIVMGLIVIAAGTSVPDALSSILVAKNGQGDMAVANVLGSNVFNIFLGLGLPWFIKGLELGIKGSITETALLLNPNEEIVLPTLILLLYVIIFITTIAIAKWKLSAKVGYFFIFAHLLFVIWSMLTMLDPPVIAVSLG